MDAAVSRLHFPVTTLGPGRRVGLWLQGCSLRCPGCISVDTWDAGFGLVPLDDLLARVGDLAADAQGFTVSGGEPFDQPDVLAAVLTSWRKASATSTFVFTGREYGDVAPWLGCHPGLIDALMTGPFRSDLPQTTALRGSDNQSLHVLSDLGGEFRTYERPVTPSDRRLDVMFGSDGDAWFAGIPARGDLARLRRALIASGHSATTSDTVGSLSR
jgi:anaerobic ribonucleoside-triphosphate reductase activating protein